MTLLQELEKAVTDSSVDIATTLRLAKRLSARLSNSEFEGWVNFELNGYPAGVSLPSYRILRVVVRGHIRLGLYQMSDAAIMTSFLPDSLENWGETSRLMRPISEYAALITGNGSGELRSFWPQEMAVKYGSKGYALGAECLGAWQLIGRAQLVGVIDSVRNRLLDFVLQIGAQAPDAGEAELGSGPVAQEAVTQAVNNYIYGGVNNISSGSNFTQAASTQVAVDDLDQLLDQLRSAGIPNRDISNLKATIETSSDKHSAAKGWLTEFALKAASDVSGTLIRIAGKAIAGYLGMGG